MHVWVILFIHGALTWKILKAHGYLTALQAKWVYSTCYSSVYIDPTILCSRKLEAVRSGSRLDPFSNPNHIELDIFPSLFKSGFKRGLTEHYKINLV